DEHLRPVAGADVSEQGVARDRRRDLCTPTAERKREGCRALCEEAQTRRKVAQLQRRPTLRLCLLADLHAPVAIRRRVEAARRTLATLRLADDHVTLAGPALAPLGLGVGAALDGDAHGAVVLRHAQTCEADRCEAPGIEQHRV